MERGGDGKGGRHELDPIRRRGKSKEVRIEKIERKEYIGVKMQSCYQCQWVDPCPAPQVLRK